MEARLDKVQTQVERGEHSKRIRAEILAHHLWLGLATGKGYLESVIW
ncbi:Uncharacterised protein [Corynebacterium ulcerans]|nr:Uncharacterised protein [Corynebacterium ulcerans]